MPTQTFSIATSADDDTVYFYDTVYPPTTNFVRDTAAANVQIARRFVSTYYYVQNGLLRFDTSSLAGATVTGATLRVYSEFMFSGDALNITGGWYQWDGTSQSDYSFTPETNAFAAVAASVFTTGADHDVTLLNAAANVSTTGYTSLRLHMDGGQPTTDNLLYLVSFNHATLSASRPRLIVTYSVPGTSVRMAPDAILSETNLSGGVSAVQDDPDSETGVWLTNP